MSQPRHFDSDVNYYEILDVPYTATKSEITHSYRRLIRSAHPDHFSDDVARHKAEERTKLLNAAYAVLSKADARREYDTAMRSKLINDALFQRYTGNTPGQGRPPVQPKSPSPEMARAQRRAQRSALTYFLLFIVLFVGFLMITLVLGSFLLELFRVLAG